MHKVSQLIESEIQAAMKMNACYSGPSWCHILDKSGNARGYKAEILSSQRLPLLVPYADMPNVVV